MKNFKSLITLLTIAAMAMGSKINAQQAGTTQVYNLLFDTAKYSAKTATIEGKTVTYRAYENIVYVSKPVDVIYQSINIYIPEAYFKGQTVDGYSAQTAPIFLPNNVGGYMPAEPGKAEGTRRMGPPPGGASPAGGAPPQQGGTPPAGMPAGASPAGNSRPNTILVALSKGYVVAAPGARGRTNKDSSGRFTGKAPAGIVDLKAAVRYLRYNDGRMPGNAEKIISNGTSAGGAMSALLGATGNAADYEPYLKNLGAADARDDIFAVSAYCPITNLDHADAAYEWQFNGVNDYKRMATTGTITQEEIAVSAALKTLFPAYVNSLNLKDKNGKTLTLESNGEGSFKAYVLGYVQSAAQKALDEGNDLSGFDYVTVKDGKVTNIDFNKYVHGITRMKTPPAFDGLSLNTGENDLFGSDTVAAKHFTAFGMANTKIPAALADAAIVKMMNPMYYVGAANVKNAAHWRIRHGTADRDGSIAVPVMLATKLQMEGKDVNLALPWNVPHSGDYDLEELFAWIKDVCK